MSRVAAVLHAVLLSAGLAVAVTTSGAAAAPVSQGRPSVHVEVVDDAGGTVLAPGVTTRRTVRATNGGGGAPADLTLTVDVDAHGVDGRLTVTTLAGAALYDGTLADVAVPLAQSVTAGDAVDVAVAIAVGDVAPDAALTWQTAVTATPAPR